MSPELVYYSWAVALIVAVLIAWAVNLFAIPGNWIIVVLTAVFAWFYPNDDPRGIRWWVVGVVVGVAVLGEIVEALAGLAGAVKQGASRRGMALAVAGTLVGSIAGAGVGIPVPLFGPIIGALGGGALGAFFGAYLGETWKGRTAGESFAIGKGALIGRLLGTLGKIVCGAVMVVIVAVDALWNS